MQGHPQIQLPPVNLGRACLFLDLDGTLVDHIDDPAAVRIDDQLRTTLAVLERQTGGALAIVSGRSITDVDRILTPLHLPVAGVHGFERRTAGGLLLRRSEETGRLNAARDMLGNAVLAMPGLHLEDKQVALALHYRTAPQWETAAYAAAHAALQLLGDQFELLEGERVIEIKPAHNDKASAIEAYLQEVPFAGRVPVFLGNDLTDVEGFAAVQRHGGLAISVGDRVRAPWRLPTSSAARQWLQRLTTTLSPA